MVSVIVNPPASPTAMRVAISTLGCKVNTFESELIAQKLVGRQYRRVDQSQQADLYLINTCTVTTEADRQARQLVRRAVRTNPHAWVVVTGCYAQMDPQACSSIPGVDLVVGNGRKHDIPELLDSLYQGELPPVLLGDIDREISLPDQLINGYDGRSRAFVQIQQGCDQGCTFCIIHKARGPNRSFPSKLIRRQIERLILNGYREVVICGVDIGSYGSDLSGPDAEMNLTRLLEQLVTVQGDFRMRLSSIDPAHLSDQLIRLIASEPSICRQLHLSLQSGNTLILKRMKRRATRESLYERINALREAVPELVLSADIMVGFPTETEVHFQDTLRAVEELEIAYPHVFAYSSRPGTPAARIPSQVEKSERKRRAALVRELGTRVWQKVANRQLGRRLRVLVEENAGPGDGLSRGRAENYFPVLFMPQNGLRADWVEVEIVDIKEDSLIARTLG